MYFKKILHKNYTINRKFYQLKLPFDTEFIIPDNDSVILLRKFVDEMDLTELYSTYSKIRENQVSPMNMLKIMLYGYMNGLYSSRDIETACRRDINFMFLLEGASPPDHSTFARFRSLHFAPCAKRLLSEVTKFLYKIGEISGKSIFIDGTKIEACANKYTFVWKKAVTKNLSKLLIKIADLVKECEELYGIKLIYKDKVQMKHVKKLRKKLYELKNLEGIEFVHGCGKRKTTLQKSIEKLEEYLLKFKEYNRKVYTCGNRNSYSKTDIDATFMRMKEDAMKNGQLKPAYNVQHGVDAGYESVKTIYICEDCSNCNYKSQCIKGNNSKIPLEKRTKKFETSKKFNRQRKEDLERIITDEGILLRMNRSIQAEGSFAQVKHDMNFKRFMCRGQKNVLAESILLAIAHNVNKLHNKIQYNRTGKYLFELKET